MTALMRRGCRSCLFANWVRSVPLVEAEIVKIVSGGLRGGRPIDPQLRFVERKISGPAVEACSIKYQVAPGSIGVDHEVMPSEGSLHIGWTLRKPRCLHVVDIRIEIERTDECAGGGIHAVGEKE